MAGGAKLVAVAPLVVVKDVAGVDHYVYAGQPLTARIPDERRKQLVAEGKLVEVDLEDPTPAQDVEVPTERPTKSAKLDVWRAYASALGVDVDGLRKDELMAAVEAAEVDDSTDDETGDETGKPEDDDSAADPDAPTIT
ncbi:hypothetical protein [Janibacter anophelis]|uniref:hypothetical protein n=1 Tax=Janibacter anophelis TaxID=319054 RepID=UPI0013B0523C|nr:hypothetical protein [Janibacter anophelis]